MPENESPTTWISFISDMFPGIPHTKIAALMYSGLERIYVSLGEKVSPDQPLSDAGKLFAKAGK